ncbi:hypothetical protein B7494_g5540 [Chlorociboria aeruginascens]|nr:hypothetical protein B7494_g5540 [Chlorociboria aeruginascens]
MGSPDAFKNRSPTFQTENDSYILPNDAKEHERLEKQHEAFIALAKGQLIVAPVGKPIKKVVDIGCGTGIVTRALRQYFVDAEHVYGIDLTSLHTDEGNPVTGPEYIHGDFMALAGTDPRLGWDSVDFAWSRFLICGLKDWQGYTDRVLKLLRPGAWAQMVDFCEDFYFDLHIGDRPQGFIANRDWDWLRALRAGGAHRGLDLDAGINIPKYMEISGFVDIQTIKFKCPYWRGAVETQPEAHLIIDLHIGDPYALYWFMIPKMLEGMGYTQEQILQFQENAQRDCGEEVGKYQVLHITIGRKPDL